MKLNDIDYDGIWDPILLELLSLGYAGFPKDEMPELITEHVSLIVGRHVEAAGFVGDLAISLRVTRSEGLVQEVTSVVITLVPNNQLYSYNIDVPDDVRFFINQLWDVPPPVPQIRIEDILGIPNPPQWESDVEKYVALQIVPTISVEHANLFHAWISKQWGSVPRLWNESMFRRDAYDVFVEASTLDMELFTTTPDMIVEHETTSGWLVIAGNQPAILAFDQESLWGYQTKLLRSANDPDAEVELPTFLFGKWIPVPRNLLDIIDPNLSTFLDFQKKMNTPEIVVNFAEFIHGMEEETEE